MLASRWQEQTLLILGKGGGGWLEEWMRYFHVQRSKGKDLEPVLPCPLWVHQQKNWANQELLWGILFYWCCVKKILLFLNPSVSTFLLANEAASEPAFLFPRNLLSFLPQASLNSAANTPHHQTLTEPTTIQAETLSTPLQQWGNVFLRFLNRDISPCPSPFCNPV